MVHNLSRFNLLKKSVMTCVIDVIGIENITGELRGIHYNRRFVYSPTHGVLIVDFILLPWMANVVVVKGETSKIVVGK